MSNWRRFERGSQDGHSGRFWAIRVVGRDCEIRFGALGDVDVTEERIEHASEAEAAREAKQKIKTKQRAGWIEVEQVDATRTFALAQGELFERAIVEDLANLDNWAVYADWLQSVEPLLGERVGLGVALARVASKSARAQLQARIDELERTHARELFGATLAGALGERKFESVIALERQHGMIVGAKLWDPEDEIVKFDALVAALLDLPLARLLLELRLETGFRRRSLARVLDVFVSRQHPHLQRLALGIEPHHGGVVAMEVPAITAVLERTPMLERLELHGVFAGNAAHERLRELKLYRPPGDLSLTLPNWHLPALERLHVIEPGAVDWHLVELPKLKQLLIEWRDCGDRLVARLAHAPLLDQLDSLVLVQTGLHAHGVRTILDNAERFAQIRQLVLFDVATDANHIAPLRERFPSIIVQHQHELGEPRRSELTRF